MSNVEHIKEVREVIQDTTAISNDLKSDILDKLGKAIYDKNNTNDSPDVLNNIKKQKLKTVLLDLIIQDKDSTPKKELIDVIKPIFDNNRQEDQREVPIVNSQSLKNVIENTKPNINIAKSNSTPIFEMDANKDNLLDDLPAPDRSRNSFLAKTKYAAKSFFKK
jgi:flagellar biosynthesis/type III secretory pathway chaperone